MKLRVVREHCCCRRLCIRPMRLVNEN